MKSNFVKVLPIFLFLFVGYGVADYQSSRFNLSDEIDDFQREISISSKLLTEYASTCNSEYSGFFAYVLHSIEKYELLIGKAKEFPFYFESSFIDDHEEIAFWFNDGLQETKKLEGICKKT